MRPRACLVLGVACLVGAQLLASLPLAGMRQKLVPNHEVYEALTPGEFAGTLMLGGFRGLACDLLWIRADNAKDQGRFYESLALFEAISRIQPRFDQIWSFMAWDMAWNIGHEVEDDDAKWTWLMAGLQTNARGCERNPQSERLLRHLAWMFHQRGDLFHDRVERTDWAPLLAPLIANINLMHPPTPLPPFPEGAGLSNFRVAAIVYAACVGLAEARHLDQPQFVRRMVPLAIESDGDLERNRGRHVQALRVWIEALESWEQVRASYEAIPDADGGANRRATGLESYVRNDGKLRRKCASMARELAIDPAQGELLAAAIRERRFADARAALAGPGWRESARNGDIRWLDEQ